MAVKFLGFEVNGKLQQEPPEELIERVRQAFQAEYDLQCQREEEGLGGSDDSDGQCKAG